MVKNKVKNSIGKITYKIISSLSILITMSFLVSCSNKGGKESLLEEQHGTLSYLRGIQKEVAENEFTASNELSAFLKAKNDYIEGNYEEALAGVLKVLYYYLPSNYETEALYILGKIIPYMLVENPNYIEECYNELREQLTALELVGDDFTIDNFYAFIGLEYRKDGSLRYNNGPLVRILEDDSSALIPKDDLFYDIHKNNYQIVRGEDDRQRFMLNINRLSFFSEMYRTSDKQAILLNNNDYFPKELPFTLSSEQKERYNGLIARIGERVEAITGDINEIAYVTGDRVRIRDRIRTSSMDDTITLHHLNDYDSVEVLRKIEVKLRGRSEPEAWVLVRYNSVYGDIVGFALARYFRNIDGTPYNIKNENTDDVVGAIVASSEDNDEYDDNTDVLANSYNTYKIELDVYSSFTNALANYRNHRYIEAADNFAYILSQDTTNYFTDKSSYLLWRVNNNIASLIASQDDIYYQYAKKYPNYFVYNAKNETLSSSMLLYSYLVNTVPNSKLKFRMSGESDMM